MSGLSIYLGWDAYLWKNDKLECSKLRNLNGVYNILLAKLASRRNIESTTQICRQLNQYLTVQSTRNTPTHTHIAAKPCVFFEVKLFLPQRCKSHWHNIEHATTIQRVQALLMTRIHVVFWSACPSNAIQRVEASEETSSFP